MICLFAMLSEGISVKELEGAERTHHAQMGVVCMRADGGMRG